MTDENTPESEHPEMDRAAAEVAAIIPAPTAGDIPAPSEDEEGDPLDGGPEEDRPPVVTDERHLACIDERERNRLDRDILAAALTRLARLHGVNVPGEHVGDFDSSGLSPEFVTLVDWAKTARIA